MVLRRSFPGIDLFFSGIDPAPGCFPELALLPNYLVMLRAYENAVICVRREQGERKAEKMKKKKRRENAAKPGRPPGWAVTFFGVVFSPHTVCKVFGEPSVGIGLKP